MARLVITCPQPWHEEYVSAFNEWCAEMEVRFAMGQRWIRDHHACYESKKTALSSTLNNMKTFRDDFKTRVGTWIDNLNTWLAKSKVWLTDQTILITNAGGDPNIMTDWQVWITDMESWIQTVNDWYADVEIILTEMVTNWNSACTDWQAANDAWTTTMEDWINSWPKGVPV